jgi:UDP-sugar transporter A1/2/3
LFLIAFDYVSVQLKIFSTAAFAIFMLGRNISACKWRALLVLVLGCILVASPTFNKPPSCDLTMLADSEKSASDSIVGVVSILVMVTISGFSACYFERMLKAQGESRITIWERNFQLAFYSLLLLLGIMWWEVFSNAQGLNSQANALDTMQAFVPFQGWTINTVLIALIQAGGGLLVAATLKYADAILKTLATSGSIVLSAVLGKVLLGGTLDIFVGIGCVATIVGIFNYTLDDSERR